MIFSTTANKLQYCNGTAWINAGNWVAANAAPACTGTYTWTDQTASGSQGWSYIVSSADGSKLAAAAYSDGIYTSADSGVTWTQQTGSGKRYWNRIASSSDVLNSRQPSVMAWPAISTLRPTAGRPGRPARPRVRGIGRASFRRAMAASSRPPPTAITSTSQPTAARPRRPRPPRARRTGQPSPRRPTAANSRQLMVLPATSTRQRAREDEFRLFMPCIRIRCLPRHHKGRGLEGRVARARG